MPTFDRSAMAVVTTSVFSLSLWMACSSTSGPDASAIADGGADLRDDARAPVVVTDGGTGVSDARSDAGDGAVVATALVHVIGRFDARDPAGPRFSWPGTQVRARFEGTGLTLKLKDTGGDVVEVAIDGAPPQPLTLTDAQDTYEVATNLTPGTHDVVLTKRTEALVGMTQLLGIVPANGALVPSPVPTGRRIEMIGDSITCGYGVLGAMPCSFDASTESETAAWGALAAAQLGALHSAVAYSGIGVYRDYGGATTEQMPVRYDRSLADDATSTWDHASQHPDVVVVNLGTNDFAQGDPGAAYTTAYASFLDALRSKHPSAFLVVATSPMLTDSWPEGEQHRTKQIAALDALVTTRKATDPKIALLVLDEQLESDGYGCDSHPNVTTQQKMAAKLVAFLKQTLGW